MTLFSIKFTIDKVTITPLVEHGLHLCNRADMIKARTCPPVWTKFCPSYSSAGQVPLVPELYTFLYAFVSAVMLCFLCWSQLTQRANGGISWQKEQWEDVSCVRVLGLCSENVAAPPLVFVTSDLSLRHETWHFQNFTWSCVDNLFFSTFKCLGRFEVIFL